MKAYLNHLLHFNLIDDINLYFASVNDHSGLSRQESTAITTALADPHFDWTASMPEGPCAGYSVLCAMILLVKKKNPAGIQAFNHLLNRTDIDWVSPQGSKRISPLECLGYVAITQQDALNKFLILLKRLKIPPTKTFRFGELQDRSFFFAMMQSIGRGQYLFKEDYERFNQSPVDWNEHTQDPQAIDAQYPHTPLYYLTLAASRGDTDALNILPKIVIRSDPKWCQKSITRLMEAALKYETARGPFYWVLACELDKGLAFMSLMNDVMNGFAHDQIISTFYNVVEFARQRVARYNSTDPLTFKTLMAVRLLALYHERIKGYAETQQLLGSIMIDKNRSHSQVIPMFLPPAPFNLHACDPNPFDLQQVFQAAPHYTTTYENYGHRQAQPTIPVQNAGNSYGPPEKLKSLM